MLVGRTLELDVLNNSFRQMLEGKGSILFLTGEAGLGKTTLVHEWWKTVAPDSAIYAEAACSIPVGNVDVGRLEALQPWADIVAQLQGHEEHGKKKLDLKKLIFDSAPAWAWALPIVGGIAHGAMETARLVKEQHSDHNPNAQNQQQVFQQYVNLLTKIAGETPLVILLDDMHWADVSSTNLLFYLSRQVATTKFLVLVTYRQDDAVAQNEGKGHPILQVKNEIIRYGGKEMPLTYLGDAAIREMLTQVFPGYQVNDRFERWLRKISDGNSLFATQYVKTLHEDGLLNDSGAFIGNYDDIKIPNSALAVVTERTRRLSEETRELLTYATAEGEEFTSYVLEQLTHKDTMQLMKELQVASKLSVIVQKGNARMYANQTTGIFGFSHALFHKALYDSLFDMQKEVLHRKCFELLKAEWDRLKETNDPRMSLASKLLTHAEKCGEIESAAEIALQAARKAWLNYAESEALEMVGHVMRLAQNKATPIEEKKRDTLLGEALLLKARIDGFRDRYDEAVQNSAQALAIFERLHDEIAIARTLNIRAALFRNNDALPESEADARRALSIAQTIGHKRLEAMAEYNLACFYMTMGAFEEAREHLNISTQIDEAIGDANNLELVLNNIGSTCNLQGLHEQAITYFKRSIDLHASSGSSDRAAIAATYNNIGTANVSLGLYDEAMDYFKQSLSLNETIGSRSVMTVVLGNIGNIYFERKEYPQALEYYLQSLEIAEAIERPLHIARMLCNIGAVRANTGEFEKGIELFQRGVAIYDTLGDRSELVGTYVNLGIVYRDRGEFVQSREYLSQALAIAKEKKMKDKEAGAMCELGLLVEREAAECLPEEKRTKLNVTVELLTKGTAIYRELHMENTSDVKNYNAALKRITESLI